MAAQAEDHDADAAKGAGLDLAEVEIGGQQDAALRSGSRQNLLVAICGHVEIE
jgi:hypothetical protein